MWFNKRKTGDATAWLREIDGPAALFGPDGALRAANAAWRNGPTPHAGMEATLAAVGLEPPALFRLIRAARQARPGNEDGGGWHVRLAPVADGALLRLSPAADRRREPADSQPRDEAASPARIGANTEADAEAIDRAARGGPADPGLADKIAAAIRNSPVGVARLSDRDPARAALVAPNPAFSRITGGGSGSLVADLFDDARRLGRLEMGSARPLEMDLAGGQGRACELWLAEDGFHGTLLAVDVTMRRDMERRLSQTSKMQAVGQIAGGVAHELNNLLLVITLNCDALLARHPVGDPSYGELQSIQNTTTRAADLVRMLLAYARKQTFRRDLLDVGEVLTEFAVLMRQVLDERIGFDIRHGRDLPMVRADKQQLETVFMNLVTNARDAVLSSGRAKGQIRVVTRRAAAQDVRAALMGAAPLDIPDGDWVAISVSDDGTGIPPEVARQIFEPFFTTKEQGKGTGIGLATVYGIVQQSGGYIALDSHVGEGTRFDVFLPAADPAQSGPEDARAPAGGEARPVDLAGRGRILLVEDEDGVRAIAAQLLAQRGYQVTEAADGEQALDLLKADPGGFDLILSDVVMPGLDGPGLLRAAEPWLGHARIVFMSGYAERDFARTLENDRSISFLPKPFTLAQLAERVKSELAVG